MRLLNSDLTNPYIKESPYFEAFEKTLSFYKEQPDSVLYTQLERQKSIFNDNNSDGFELYEAEEKSHAIHIVLSDRSSEYKNSLILEKIKTIDLTPDILAENPYKEDDILYKGFENQVSALCLKEKKELYDELNEYSEAYINKKTKDETYVKNHISMLKCAIVKIG